MSIIITSPAFLEGELIPRRFTCDGDDISPPLNWTGIPENTRSLALICDDPDAPVGTWDHWLLFDLPADSGGLPEAVPDHPTLDNGAVHGNNSWGRPGYGGPCPPGGTHRYFFRLYALDTRLELESGVAKSRLIETMKGHILDQGELMGRYHR